MGGLTFNVANLGVIADIIATNTERTNATGQGNTWSKLAENLSGMGILELNIGTEGITASLGTDGFDLFFRSIINEKNFNCNNKYIYYI